LRKSDLQIIDFPLENRIPGFKMTKIFACGANDFVHQFPCHKCGDDLEEESAKKRTLSQHAMIADVQLAQATAGKRRAKINAVSEGAGKSAKLF